MFNDQQPIILYPLLPILAFPLRLLSPNGGNRILAQNRNEPNRAQAYVTPIRRLCLITLSKWVQPSPKSLSKP